ncbi:hypothetical protein [Actinomadura atramentaria]|uniref:hypothetical protein n=1 Tax=Actinomadura atramentaria TaxID=1990 RepID=UPI00035D66F0|nr:hypothetical protein [Actinomadura atramentaria]
MSVQTLREYRVWCETGDYVGGAEVTTGGHESGRHGYLVWPHPFDSAESDEPSWRASEGDAFTAARELAEEYLGQAVADATDRFGEPPVGVMSEYGYHVQVVEDGQDVTAHQYAA